MNFPVGNIHVLVVASLDFYYRGVVKINKKIEIRVTEKEKEFIQERSKELGFKSMTAFLKSSAKDFFMIELDLSFFREVTKELYWKQC